MGMFDIFVAEVKCPHCGERSEIDFNTKELDCDLHAWRVGDKIELTGNLFIKDGEIKNALGDCKSKVCMEWGKENIGYASGFGRSVFATIVIKESTFKEVKDIGGDEEP